MLRYIYISLGFVSLTLGLVGIITPGCPTTPFLMLTAYLFMKGSPRLHQKLHKHRVTGYYLNKISTGLSPRVRLISMGLMWCMVCFTAFVVFDKGTMRMVMIALGAVGTIAQLIVLGRKRTKAPSVSKNSEETVNATIDLERE